LQAWNSILKNDGSFYYNSFISIPIIPIVNKKSALKDFKSSFCNVRTRNAYDHGKKQDLIQIKNEGISGTKTHYHLIVSPDYRLQRSES
jgi:hypothetical protein